MSKHKVVHSSTVSCCINNPLSTAALPLWYHIFPVFLLVYNDLLDHWIMNNPAAYLFWCVCNVLFPLLYVIVPVMWICLIWWWVHIDFQWAFCLFLWICPTSYWNIFQKLWGIVEEVGQLMGKKWKVIPNQSQEETPGFCGHICERLYPRQPCSNRQSITINFHGSILHTFISYSYLNLSSNTHLYASVHALHTRVNTHMHCSVCWGVWTAPTDCASLPLYSGVPVVPSPIAVNATIWCATWTS